MNRARNMAPKSQRSLVAVISLLAGSACVAQPTLFDNRARGDIDDAGAMPAPVVNVDFDARPVNFQPAPKPCNPCDDFPASAIVEAANGGSPLPDGVATAFASKPTGKPTSGGPCLIEPQGGALIPRNWLRPRFRMKPGPGQNAFEIRLHSKGQKNDLVVYTASPTWTMPASMWQGLSQHTTDVPIEFVVRALDSSVSPPRVVEGTSGVFTIAPVDASGTVVYWTTSGGSAFKGFTIGGEKVVKVIDPPMTDGKCVGCHTSTPDGEYVAFSSTSDPMSGDPAHIELRAGSDPKRMPPFLTPAAIRLMNRNEQELPTFSNAHWRAGDHLMLTTWQRKLMWTDLEAKSEAEDNGWGFVVRTGDTRQMTTPAFSHDGSFVVYTSASDAQVSSQVSDGDIFRVEFGSMGGGKRGGAAKGIKGASETNANEFYPAISADDRLVAFSRSRAGSYNDASSEIYVVPSAGGAATRLAANDPCPCLQKSSPGVTNSWPKWSPAASVLRGSSDTDPDRTFYWLVFSSKRDETQTPQLYAAGVVVRGGEVMTYPALYLWNQPAGEGNHTPAWDVFEIPPVD